MAGNVAHNGVKVLNKKADDEIEKLKKHISKGCLSFIPVGGGTNRNGNLQKKLEKKSFQESRRSSNCYSPTRNLLLCVEREDVAKKHKIISGTTNFSVRKRLY